MESSSPLAAPEFSRACLCLNTQRAARAVARLYDRALKPFALTSGQFSILAALNQPGPVTLGELAAILGLDRTTLTRNLSALQSARLIGEDEAEDKRLRSLRLTSAGRAKLRAAVPAWSAAQEQALARLDQGAWGSLQPALARLATVL